MQIATTLPEHPRLRVPGLLHLVLFAGAYVAAAALGQWLELVPGHSATLWPPSGLYLAVLLLCDQRTWGKLLLAGWLADVFSDIALYNFTVPVALGAAMGNSLEALCSAILIRRHAGTPFRFQGLRDVTALALLGGGVGPIISAVIGALVMAWSGRQSFIEVAPLWWMGDAIGVLVVAPLVLVGLTRTNWLKIFSARKKECMAFATIFLTMSAIVLSGHFPFAFIALPLLIWGPLRFGLPGAALVLCSLAAMVVRNTAQGHGIFANPMFSRESAALVLQLFLGIISVSFLMLAALVEQDQLNLRDLKRALDELEFRVAQRKELERQVVEVVADEQRRLGQELHDGLGQELTAISLMAGYVQEYLRQLQSRSDATATSNESPDFEKLHNAVDNLCRNLKVARHHLRDLSRGIMPVQIDAEGLRSALDELASSVSNSHRLTCRLDYSQGVMLASNSTATHLYRIAQEAVNNAVKHSQASQIQISVRQNGSTTLEVTDNGIGIDINATHTGRQQGMGLRTMQYRASILNATLDIHKLQGGGTAIRCMLSGDGCNPDRT